MLKNKESYLVYNKTQKLLVQLLNLLLKINRWITYV